MCDQNSGINNKKFFEITVYSHTVVRKDRSQARITHPPMVTLYVTIIHAHAGRQTLVLDPDLPQMSPTNPF